MIAVAGSFSVYAKAAASIPASTGASLTGVTVMFRVSTLLSAAPSLTVKLTVRVARAGVVAGVLVLHRPQGRLVVGHRVAAAQGQRAGGRVPRSRDSARVGERQHVLAVLVVAGDLDGGPGQVGVVHVAGRDRRRDRRGRIVLRVAKAAASIPASTGASLTGVTVMLPRQHVAVGRAVVDREAHRPRRPLGLSLVFWYFTARKAAW